MFFYIIFIAVVAVSLFFYSTFVVVIVSLFFYSTIVVVLGVVVVIRLRLGDIGVL